MIKFSELFASKRPEPSYPKLPDVSASHETARKNVYAIGDVAGNPLVKISLNAGYDLVNQLIPELEAARSSDVEYDLVIVGSGPCGLGAAFEAEKQGLRYLVLEGEQLAQTFYTMAKGKLIFTEPHNIENKSDLFLQETTKDEIYNNWQKQIEEKKINIHFFEKVVDIQGSTSLSVVTAKAKYSCSKVILAVGKAGNPRKANVPGEKEFPEKVEHFLSDPDRFSGKNVFVYGGGDVACEGVINLAKNNNVTMVTIDKEFVYPKKRNSDAILALAKEGKINLHFASQLAGFDETTLTFKDSEDKETTIDNDVVFEMIGAELPLQFFRKVGVRLEGDWYGKRYLYLAAVFFFVYSLYALKSYGKGITAWPYEHLISPEVYSTTLKGIFTIFFAPLSSLFNEQALSDIYQDKGYQQGYLYSLLYTVLMLVFGYKAFIRWKAKAANASYQKWRYTSLVGFQLVFFFIVNIVAVNYLTVKYAWRAWGLYQPFPLFFNTFFWWYEGDPVVMKWFFIISGLIGTFVLIPIMARYHGKRFCTWICGCGGLAETLGDRWRHLSAKGKRSRDWNFQGSVVMVAAFLIGMIVVGMYNTDGNNVWWRTYNYLIDFWLVAVIPIAAYPFFGGKVWCRYWCPLAAYNGILASWFGKLGITANSKCISCTQCSRHCQVGVDVMAFAKNQKRFDNKNSNCIHCGICIDVCPMNVLEFDSKE